MTYVCLSSPSWPTAAGSPADLAGRMLALVPRARLEPARGVAWADARGLDAPRLAARLVDLLRTLGIDEARAGVAATPIAAEVASRVGAEPVTVVPPGADREFLSPWDVGVLHPPPPRHLYPLFAAVGIVCCGDLARLDSEAVEVRFGGEGVRLWRLARADDHRPIFDSRPRELPHAELEWVDYELADQAQVVFVVNSLLASVTDLLAGRREGAHAMVLEFTLADRIASVHPVRSSNPTADRKVWLRVIRAALETVTFGAPVTKIALSVVAATPLVDRQGNLFDQGFATARTTEAALAHLLDKQADAIVVATRSRHPLPERRIDWVADPTGQVGDEIPSGPESAVLSPGLTIQLVTPPLPIEVRTATRRDALIPSSYFDGVRGYPVTACLGPDRVSGGLGETPFERDYFQVVRDDGTMVLLYRDLLGDRWYLAGWWD